VADAVVTRPSFREVRYQSRRRGCRDGSWFDIVVSGYVREWASEGDKRAGRQAAAARVVVVVGGMFLGFLSVACRT
jgi:hypothetical protein